MESQLRERYRGMRRTDFLQVPEIAAYLIYYNAELNSLLLTAGHDLDQIQGSIRLDSANGEEIYTLLNGEKVTCKSGDMVLSDRNSVFCSVIFGQDQRTKITQITRNVLYAVYVPNGIPSKMIENHLLDFEENVHLITPQAETELRHIYFAKPADPTLN